MRSLCAMATVFALTCTVSGTAMPETPEEGSGARDHKSPGQAREFTISGVETLSPRAHMRLRTYEVCVRPVANNAPLKAVVDGSSFSIPVGECRVLTGRQMTFLSLHKLVGEAHIVFTYQEMPRARHADVGKAGEPT